ncbi:hypothetical protein ACI8AK_02365 [Geodermatophilus sp. SYSU D00867]
MRVVTLPYLQAETEPQCGQWIVELRGDRQPLPLLLKGWDYTSTITLESIVRVSRDQVLRECGLPDDAEIAVTALWSASSTTARSVGATVPIVGDRAINLAFDVPPGVAGGRLTIERLIVLLRPGTGGAALSATRPGSVLWRESRDEQASCLLEGDASRFPTDVIDFGQSGLGDAGGIWWLQHDLTDLDANPLACLRIRINSAHPVGTRLVRGTADSEEIRSVLFWDVHRLLVHAALDSDDFISGWGTFRIGSLGHTLEQICRRLWPYEDARSLRASRDSGRSRFEAAMQARTGLLAEAVS